jgi:hypothetical protein
MPAAKDAHMVELEMVSCASKSMHVSGATPSSHTSSVSSGIYTNIYIHMLNIYVIEGDMTRTYY